jgi:hypothetical protein
LSSGAAFAKGVQLINFGDFVGRYVLAHPDYRDPFDPQHPGH